MTNILILATHEMLERVWGKEIPTPIDKGYPNCFSEMTYWVLLEEDDPVAYTCSKGFGDFTLVGNTYVKSEYRKRGSHSKLLSERNKRLGGVLVTVLNPIEESNMFHLAKVVSRLGYTQVKSYDDVSDIMTKEMYEEVSFNAKQQVWRMQNGSSLFDKM